MRIHAQGIFRVLLISIVVLAGCSMAPLKPETTAPGVYEYTKHYTSSLIQKEMKKHHVMALSIALVDDQRVVWAEGFGYADAGNKVLATPETVYWVGSISKLFTATAAMQLYEQGKIDIDQPLQTYLPEFSIKTRFSTAGPITPRNIMTHHSGLPSNLYKGMWTKTPEPFTSVVREIKDDYAAYPPNFVFSYSNLAVTLLGHMVERISGEDFVSHVDKSVLRPLGMFHSSFSLQRDGLLAKGYRNSKENDDPPMRDLPAGGLTSNVLDLSRFMEMVFADGRSGERQILKPETLAEMLRPQNSDVVLDLNFRVGLGWILSSVGDIDIQNGGPVTHHSGATLVFHSQLVTLPEHKLGVVVLSNSSSARSVVNKVASEALKLALEAKTGIKQPEQEKPAESNSSLPLSVLQSYEGYYATLLGLAKINMKKDYLQAEVMDTTFRLVPRSDGLLGLKYKLLGLVPKSPDGLDLIGISHATVVGHDILFARFGNQDLLIGEKISPVSISEKWLQRAGAYEAANSGDDTLILDGIRLGYNDGLLIMECSMPFSADGTMIFALFPVSDNEAVILGLGGGMGETIRVITVDGKEGLYYSGYQFKKKTEQ